MKWISYIAAGLLLAVIGCSNLQESQLSDLDADVANVMTFNIRYGTANDGVNHWDNRRKKVVDVIEAHGADVVGLQEALDFQVQYLKEAMPQYAVYYVGRDDGAKAGESSAILYRQNRYKLVDSGTFWFSKTPSIPSMHWGKTKHLRICSWVRLVNKADGKGLYVYNLHLDNSSQSSRVESTKLLAKRISLRKEKEPYIVMGDFNMNLDNSGMKYLLKTGIDTPYPPMISAWRSMHPNLPDTQTGHGFKGSTVGSAIDHILVEEGTQVIKAEIDQRAIDGLYPSDHYPVTASVKLY